MSHWIQKRGNYWVIVQRGSNKVLSRHASKAQADEAFRVLEADKHPGGTPRKPFRRTLAHRYLGG